MDSQLISIQNHGIGLRNVIIDKSNKYGLGFNFLINKSILFSN